MLLLLDLLQLRKLEDLRLSLVAALASLVAWYGCCAVAADVDDAVLSTVLSV